MRTLVPLMQWKHERETGNGDQTSLEEMKCDSYVHREEDSGEGLRLGGEKEQISEQE